jgi:aspartyl-tRNA(Asn)/glutamyl-tRNA(Gln) amidotransferase subunit A
MPTVPKLPHKLGSKISIEDMYDYDALTVLANLAEIPAINVPAGKINDIPVGLQILAPKFREDVMFSVAEQF